MKIGKLVQSHIGKILQRCDDDELRNLMDKQYSKDIFGINYPFCAEIENIPHVRYYAATHHIRGKTLRVCSQWFETSREPFCRYVISKNIADFPCPRPTASPLPSFSPISPEPKPDTEVIKDPVVTAAQLAFSVRLKDSKDVSENTKDAQRIAKAWRAAVHDLNPERFQIEAMVAPELDQKIDVVDRKQRVLMSLRCREKTHGLNFTKTLSKSSFGMRDVPGSYLNWCLLQNRSTVTRFSTRLCPVRTSNTWGR